MCGIIGILSKHVSVTPNLLESITELQNRGYDSAGISVMTEEEGLFETYKYASTRTENAVEILKRNVNTNKNKMMVPSPFSPLKDL
jgi:glucosamine--fructose-6-phosphate aminotransferase (isomerizing)